MRLPSIVRCLATSTNKSNDDIDIVNSLTSCDDITGLTISNNPESTGVTTFVQEACDSVDVLGKHRADSTIVKLQHDFQDLKEYFRRPRSVSAGPFILGTFNGTSWPINKNTLFSTIFPNGFDRLEGVLGVRFDAVFTLQVAATPFHQGVVSMNWQYMDASTINNYMRWSNAATATNIPHVRLDLAESTMAVLKVPYLYMTEYLPINENYSSVSDIWEYGTLGLTVILPVRAGATAPTPSYRIMMHLENLEIFGAAPYQTTSLVLQSGKLKPINEEFENDAYPFSSGLHTGSKTMRWIAKGIPSLASLASPAAWALGRAAGLARYFGYSKPQIQEPIQRMQVVSSVAEHNVDVPSATIVAGPMASNALTFGPEFGGTDVDEMSLSYVLSRWGQIRTGRILTSNPVGTRLYATPICPDCFWYRSSGASPPFCNIPSPNSGSGSTFMFIPSHVHFFSSMFRYWRGDLEFRFTFAKTKFHGGRVIAQFTPNNEGQLISATPTVIVAADTVEGPSMFGHSAIFDLRDGNQFTFKVPFTSDVPYMDFFSSIGSLTLSVFDVMLAPETVSSTIEFLVEVRACSNYELAAPVGPLYPQATNAGTILQSGQMVAITAGKTDELCIGERINSLKQLIMLPKATVTSITASSTLSFWIPPWYWHPYNVNTLVQASYLKNSFSFGGNIAKAFLFARGGTDMHAYNFNNTSLLHHAFVGAAYNNFVSSTRTRKNRSGMSVPRVTASNTELHVRYPAYQQTVRMHNMAYDHIIWDPDNANRNPVFTSPRVGPVYAYRYTVSNTAASISTLLINRSASDDAALAHYMGPCPNLLVDNTATSVWDPDSNANYQSGIKVCMPVAGHKTQSPFVVDSASINSEVKDDVPSAPPPLRRSPSGNLLPSRPQVSGDRGVSPASLAGKLTNITHTLSPALLAAVQTIEAAAEIANATK